MTNVMTKISDSDRGGLVSSVDTIDPASDRREFLTKASQLIGSLAAPGLVGLSTLGASGEAMAWGPWHVARIFFDRTEGSNGWWMNEMFRAGGRTYVDKWAVVSMNWRNSNDAKWKDGDVSVYSAMDSRGQVERFAYWKFNFNTYSDSYGRKDLRAQSISMSYNNQRVFLNLNWNGSDYYNRGLSIFQQFRLPLAWVLLFNFWTKKPTIPGVPANTPIGRVVKTSIGAFSMFFRQVEYTVTQLYPGYLDVNGDWQLTVTNGRCDALTTPIVNTYVVVQAFQADGTWGSFCYPKAAFDALAKTEAGASITQTVTTELAKLAQYCTSFQTSVGGTGFGTITAVLGAGWVASQDQNAQQQQYAIYSGVGLAAVGVALTGYGIFSGRQAIMMTGTAMLQRFATPVLAAILVAANSDSSWGS